MWSLAVDVAVGKAVSDVVLDAEVGEPDPVYNVKESENLSKST